MELTPCIGKFNFFFFFYGKFNGYFSKGKLANFCPAAIKSFNEQEDK